MLIKLLPMIAPALGLTPELAQKHIDDARQLLIDCKVKISQIDARLETIEQTNNEILRILKNETSPD